MPNLTTKKKPTTKGQNLTEKQILFVRNYLIDYNATQAAIKTGYSEDSAGSISHALMQNVAIQKEIDKQVELRTERLDITADKIVVELARIAFADLRDVAQVIDGKVVISDTVNLTKAQAAVISELQQLKDGVKVKTHSKIAAIDQLCKIFGLHKSTLDITGLLTLANESKPFDVVIVDPAKPAEQLEHDISRPEQSDDSEVG